MKKLLLFLFVTILSFSAFAQNLEVVKPLSHKGPFSAGQNKTDNNGKYCAVIDISLPSVSFSVEGSYILDKNTITNGWRIFVSVPSKAKQISVKADGFQDFTFDVSTENINPGEAYEIALKVPEKQQVVVQEPKDQNTGKAYLILNINEENAIVKIDGQKISFKGTQFKMNFPYKKYTVNISKPGFESQNFEVVLKDAPVIKKIELQAITVNLTVRCEDDAQLIVDKENLGSARVVSVTANKSHIIKVTRNGIESTQYISIDKPTTIEMYLSGSLKIDVKTPLIKSSKNYAIKQYEPCNIKVNGYTWLNHTERTVSGKNSIVVMCGKREKKANVFVGKNQKITKKFAFAPEIYGCGFLGYTYSPKALAGINFGWAKRFGFYADFGTSILTATTYERSLADDGAELKDRFVLKDIQTSSLLTKSQFDGFDNLGSYRFYGHAGPMVRPLNWLGFWVAGGYGCYADTYEYDGMIYSPSVAKGPEFQFGTFIKLPGVALTCGYSRILGSEKFDDFYVGISGCWKTSKYR